MAARPAAGEAAAGPADPGYPRFPSLLLPLCPAAPARWRPADTREEMASGEDPGTWGRVVIFARRRACSGVLASAGRPGGRLRRGSGLAGAGWRGCG